MKPYKRILAASLAAVLFTTALTGCGGNSASDDTSSDNAGKNTYAATVAATIDVTLSTDIQIKDDKLYTSYSSYSETDDSSEIGLILYDFSSGETTKAVIEPTALSDLYVDRFYVDADGSVHVAAVAYTYTYEESDTSETASEEELASSDSTAADEDTYSYTSQTITLVYDSALSLVSREEGEPVTGEEESSGEYIYRTYSLSDGRRLLVGDTYTDDVSSSFVRVTDENDNKLGEISLGENGTGGTLAVVDDAHIYCARYGTEGYEVCALNPDTYEAGDTICTLDWDFTGNLYAGADGKLLAILDGYYVSIDPDSGETTQLFRFLDCDINPDNLCGLFMLADGTLGAVCADYDNEYTDLYTFKKQDPDTAVQKTEVHLITAYTDSQLQENVIAFNKTSDKYRIVIDAYLEGTESDEDYETAVQKMNAAIVSGDNIDIVDLSSVDYKQLAQKGALEDLLPYLEADEELSPELFVQSILNAYKIDGALYTLPAGFLLNALAGRASDLGDDPSWTLSEFVSYVKSLPEGTEVIDLLTSDGLLQTMLICCMDDYVDWTTGECHFDTEDFISLLELCSNYQTSEKLYEDYDYDNEPSEVTKIRNKQVALMQLSLYDVASYLVAKETFGEAITVKGYPSTDSTGITITSAGTSLGIHAKSDHKDVAWDFIRTFYSEDSQTSWQLSGFPVRQDCLEAVLADAKKPSDAEDDIYTEYGYEDIELTIPYATDDDIAALLAVIDNADMTASTDSEIYSMVSEEAESFFEGQKTAADVADVIQSRVSIYVNENR